MKNKGNLILIVLFFALLSFAMWRFFAVREEALTAMITNNMYTLRGHLEEFRLRAGAYPVDLDTRVSQAVDTLESNYSVAEALETDAIVNPFGGTPLIILAPGSKLPDQGTPGSVVYVPMDTLPGGKLARDYRLSGFNRKGQRLGLVLSGEAESTDTVEMKQ